MEINISSPGILLVYLIVVVFFFKCWLSASAIEKLWETLFISISIYRPEGVIDLKDWNRVEKLTVSII